MTASQRFHFINLALKRQRPGSGSLWESRPAPAGKKAVANKAMKLHELIRSCRFAIVGGLATRLYMPERHTLDVDILISEDDRSLVARDLVAAGAERIDSLAIPGETWRFSDGQMLDVLWTSDSWATRALAERVTWDDDGEPYLTLPWLVLMKLKASRVQDLADISRMLARASDSELDRLREIIKRHEPSAIDDIEGLIVLGKMEAQRRDEDPAP